MPASVRFWIDYVTPGAGEYIYDDAGNHGGIAADARFVIVGDQNLDPNDGDGMRDVGQRLLATPGLQDPHPRSLGGPEDADRIVSAAADRVWMMRGLPHSFEARMCARKRSRCQSRSPLSL